MLQMKKETKLVRPILLSSSPLTGMKVYTYSTTAFEGLHKSLMPDGKHAFFFAVGCGVGHEAAAPFLLNKAFHGQKGMLPPNENREMAVMVGLSTAALCRGELR